MAGDIEVGGTALQVRQQQTYKVQLNPQGLEGGYQLPHLGCWYIVRTAVKGIVFKNFSLGKGVEIREFESSRVRYNCKESIKLGMQGRGGREFGPPSPPPPPNTASSVIIVISDVFFFSCQGMQLTQTSKFSRESKGVFSQSKNQKLDRVRAFLKSFGQIPGVFTALQTVQKPFKSHTYHCPYFPNCFQYISYGANNENLFNPFAPGNFAEKRVLKLAERFLFVTVVL